MEGYERMHLLSCMLYVYTHVILDFVRWFK